MITVKLKDAAGEINGGPVEDARSGTGGGRKRRISPAILICAACMCLLIAGAVLVVIEAGGLTVRDNEDDDGEYADDTVISGQAAVGIYIDGCDNIIWFPITFEERQRYGLVPPGSIGLTPENTYNITEADLGEPMGAVSDFCDVPFIGSTVYHYAARPDSLGICIADTDTGYEFYCADGIYAEDADSIDDLLGLYGFPENCAYIEIQQPDGTPIYRLTGREDIERLCELISGREDIGHEAAERRFAQAWHDAYGNDDVYYSEAEGGCAYRDDGVEPEERVYTDTDGTEVTEYIYPEGYRDISETAYELWSEGERCIVLYAKNDLRFGTDYFPSIGVMFAPDGQYDIPEDAAEELAGLIYRE